MTILHHYPPNFAFNWWDAAVDTTRARNKLNRAILGRFNPTALVMSEDDIRRFVTDHASDIRDDFPDDIVTEDDLQDQIILALSRWLPLTLDTWDDYAAVELKDILYLPRKFYPGGRRPEMSRDFKLTVGGEVNNSK